MRLLPRTAVAACLSALLLSLVGAPSAQAVTSFTVTGRVVNTSGEPIEGVTVEAYLEDDDFDTEVDFAETGTDGVFSKTTSSAGGFRKGTWSFDIYQDGDDAIYQYRELNGIRITGTLTDLGDVTLQLGASQGGTVLAPSGRKVSNVLVGARKVGSEYPFEDADISGDDGEYTITGLAPGRYDFRYMLLGDFDFDFEDSNLTPVKGSARTLKAGVVAPDLNIRGVKVRCDSGLYVSSPSRGTTKIVIKSTAGDYGLRNPGGRMSLARDGKIIRDFAWNGSSKTITLANQTKGKKFTYKAVYTGGDCFRWYSTKKVTVKK